MKWVERIKKAKIRGRFTTHDIILACEWRTCAVGEKYGGKIPKSMKLGDWGVAFAEAVSRQDLTKATSLYNKIANRKPEAKE